MRRVMQGPLNGRQIASQSDQQTGTSANVFVAPSVQQQHKSAVQAWAYTLLSATGSALITGYNISTVSLPATGVNTFYFTNEMASANYSVMATPILNSGSTQGIAHAHTLTTSSFIVYVKNGNTGALISNHLGLNVAVNGLLA
jgi:hypothetical protein